MALKPGEKKLNEQFYDIANYINSKINHRNKIQPRTENTDRTPRKLRNLIESFKIHPRDRQRVSGIINLRQHNSVTLTKSEKFYYPQFCVISSNLHVTYEF